MTKMIFALTAFIAANVIVYLAFAFVAWELDPSTWYAWARAMCIVLGIAWGLSAMSAGEMK